MKSADEIITSARYRTGQSKFTYDSSTGVTSAGIATSLFIEYLNDAQDFLQSRILKLYPSLFQAEKTFSIVANQESYSIGSQLSFGTKVISVQYSSSGNTINYTPLQKTSLYDRRGVVGYPTSYFVQGGSIFLMPIPATSTGSLRVLYYKRLDDLDISRGTINGTPSGTSIVVTSADHAAISAATYVCISDKFGNVLLRNGVVSSYNSGTSTITLAANVSTYLETGYALADLASKYLTLGANTNRFSGLADECERFLRAYVQKRIMTTNENSASIEEDGELKMMLSDILDAYGEEARDTEMFPVTDYDTYY